MTVGEAIWYARDKRALTQATLAAMLHVGRPQVAMIEVGRTNPSLDTLEEIARALNCTFSTDGDYWRVTLYEKASA